MDNTNTALAPMTARKRAIITLRTLDRPATAKEIKVTAPEANVLVREELIKIKGVRHVPSRGRPANLYMLTDKARKRADRLIKRGVTVEA